MNQSKQISQVVSVLPVVVAILILFLGGISLGPTNLGSWFYVTEDYQYTDVDSDALSQLVEKAHYNYFFDDIESVQYAATEGEDPGPSTKLTIQYLELGFEQRSSVFYNIGLVFYATLILSLMSSLLIFVIDYKLLPRIGKNDLLAGLFGGYIAVIVFVLFIIIYTVMSVPDAMHNDHLGGEKDCLYLSDITIGGQSECGGTEEDTRYFDGKEAILSSKWVFGPGFILFVSGMFVPSIYMLSTTYQRFEEESKKIEQSKVDPELYFDVDAKLLFDINTGEVLGSFQYEGEDRNFFFDEEAMILWDEDTGDVMYGGPDDVNLESEGDKS